MVAVGRPAVVVGRAAHSVGEETRQRLIDAALDTLREQGITGATGRCIARRGAINQALIFYHFGSVDGLLTATARAEGARRAARYASAFEAVTSLTELVAVARRVHEDEQRDGAVTVLAQLIAGSSASPELQAGVFDAMRPWLALVEEAIERVVADSPFKGLVSGGDLAFTISSFFIGFEMMTSLDPTSDRARTLFDALERLAVLFGGLIGGTP